METNAAREPCSSQPAFVSRLMLKDHIRSCNVCGSEIRQGENYLLSVIPKEQFELVEELMEEIEPDARPSIETDSNGNMTMDICLNCYLRLGISGTETIN